MKFATPLHFRLMLSNRYNKTVFEEDETMEELFKTALKEKTPAMRLARAMKNKLDQEQWNEIKLNESLLNNQLLKLSDYKETLLKLYFGFNGTAFLGNIDKIAVYLSVSKDQVNEDLSNAVICLRMLHESRKIFM